MLCWSIRKVSGRTSEGIKRGMNNSRSRVFSSHQQSSLHCYKKSTWIKSQSSITKNKMVKKQSRIGSLSSPLFLIGPSIASTCCWSPFEILHANAEWHDAVIPQGPNNSSRRMTAMSFLRQGNRKPEIERHIFVFFLHSLFFLLTAAMQHP